MINYSVVLGALPGHQSEAHLYLEQACSVFAEAAEIIVPTSLTENEIGVTQNEFFDWIEKYPVRIVTAGETSWELLNNAVASASAEIVLVSEGDWWPSHGIERWIDRNFSQRTEYIVYFERRDSTLAAIHEMSRDRYARSIRRTSNFSNYVYAISRENFMNLRGYDERKAYVNIASSDFRKRIADFGLQVVNIEDKQGCFYHAEEVCSATSGHSNATDMGEIAEQLKVDSSIYRNLVKWSVPVDYRSPLVSVAIATKNRGHVLEDSLYSVLYQTFQDFEIIVVDDGSEDRDAANTVAAINDPRIRYVRQDSQGISAARNRAADMSSGILTAVHDDDDIMLPDRLEVGIRSLTREVDASFGGWVNFDDETGELRPFHGKETFDSAVNAYNGQTPGHATWTLPTRWVRSVRYDERIPASVDHNLATRLEMSGVRWRTTGQFMYLRRVHKEQVTTTLNGRQKYAHRLTRYASSLLSSRADIVQLRATGKNTDLAFKSKPSEIDALCIPFLPDKLVNRQVNVTRNTQHAQFAADTPDRMLYILEDRNLVTGRPQYEGAVLEPVTLKDLGEFRRRGLLGLEVLGELSINAQKSESESVPAEASTIYEDELAMDYVSESVDAALTKRLNQVVSEYFSRFPHACVLVVPEAESYHLWEDDNIQHKGHMARRILVAGEFGVRKTVRLYGFADQTAAIKQLSRIQASNCSLDCYITAREQLGNALQSTALSMSSTETNYEVI